MISIVCVSKLSASKIILKIQKLSCKVCVMHLLCEILAAAAAMRRPSQFRKKGCMFLNRSGVSTEEDEGASRNSIFEVEQVIL